MLTSTNLTAPGRSVKSILPSGKKTSSHGMSRFFRMTSVSGALSDGAPGGAVGPVGRLSEDVGVLLLVLLIVAPVGTLLAVGEKNRWYAIGYAIATAANSASTTRLTIRNVRARRVMRSSYCALAVAANPCIKVP